LINTFWYFFASNFIIDIKKLKIPELSA